MNLRPRRVEPPRVDITPLIDVVFLMLIFFMVSTTFDKQTQLKVDLPEASTIETAEPDDDKIDVKIDMNGQFYVNERELVKHCLLYTSPSPRDGLLSRMPSSA